jgi:hypothetical protein
MYLLKQSSREHFMCQPQTKDDLHQLILKSAIDADLNNIDTSSITDMSFLFKDLEFNGSISQWDVSNVTTMEGMFAGSQFNGDISAWNVELVTNMKGMFWNSKFTGDIRLWDVSKAKTDGMFMLCSILTERKPLQPSEREQAIKDSNLLDRLKKAPAIQPSYKINLLTD